MDEFVESITPEKPLKKTRAKLLELNPNEVGCDFCPLMATWKDLTTPKMPLSGNKIDPEILVLGEAPGRNEDFEGKIFIGASGKLLRAEFPSKHVGRLAFQNTIRCRPPENRTPVREEIHACSIHLDADIERLPIKAILGTGNIPLHKFFPEAQILKIHGTRFPVKLGNKIIWYYPVFHPSYVLRTDRDGSSGKVKPCFSNDIARFFKEVDRWEDPKIMELSPAAVTIPRSRREAEALIARMADPVAVDIETNGLYPYVIGAKILSAAFSDGQTTVSFAVDHPEHQNAWGLSLLLDTVRKRRWIAHNASFELSWFRFFSPGDAFSNFDDTMALARIYHQRESILSLEVQSRIHLGVNVKKIVNVNASKIANYTLAEILPYNGLDAMATAPIYKKLHKLVDKENYQRLLRTVDSTVGMELQGLPVNITTAQKFKKQWGELAIKQEEDVKQFVEVEAYARDNETEFNIASPRQLAKILKTYTNVELPLTAKGALSTNKKALEEVAPDNKLVQAVLDYREAVKLESTYIDAVLEAPEIYVDGMLHPGYTVMFTSTSRLSSRNPNIQNFPRRRNGEIRNMIEVPKGYVFLAFDYAQLEARVLAMASQDRTLCESILSGRDIHGDWRDRLLQLYPEWIDVVMQRQSLEDSIDEKTLLKILRDRAKNEFVFASFYGSAAPSCAEAMGLPLAVLQELAIQLWSEFPDVKRWLKARRVEYQETGAMRTLTNRVRYQILYKFNEPVNTPIQGTAADIVADAMNDMTLLSRERNDNSLHSRIQIHDDLCFIVPESSNLEYYVDTISAVLTKVRYPWQVVPLAVEVKIGTKWAELEEFAVITGGYNR